MRTSAEIVVAFILACLVLVAPDGFGPKCPVHEDFEEHMRALHKNCKDLQEDEGFLCMAKATGIVDEEESNFSIDVALMTADMFSPEGNIMEEGKEAIRNCGSISKTVHEFVKCSKEAIIALCN